MTGIMAQLRRETRQAHRDAERSPLARRMLQGTMVSQEYRQMVLGMYGLTSCLEQTLAASPSAVVRNIAAGVPSRLPHLAADLEFWNPHERLHSAVDRAQHSAALEMIRTVPRAALGWLYVLEGSSLGAQILAPRIAAGLGVSQTMLQYMYGHGPATRDVWHRLCRDMDRSLDGTSELDAADIVHGACAAFAGVRRIFDAVAGSRFGDRPSVPDESDVVHLRVHRTPVISTRPAPRT